VTHTYDADGNLASQTNTSTHVTTSYTYDYRDRLTNVSVGGAATATYTYDALDRRIGIKDSGTQTWTAYDGTSADALPYADFSGSGSLTQRYLSGVGVINGALVDQLLARTTSGGTTAWYLPDKLGTVRDIVDGSGNELDHIVYDSFGNITTETNATNGDRFKFAGMEYDAAIGQYYDRARGYGPALGRFVQQDPLGFASGDVTLYRYAGNNPPNLTDPTGLQYSGSGGNMGPVYNPIPVPQVGLSRSQRKSIDDFISSLQKIKDQSSLGPDERNKFQGVIDALRRARYVPIDDPTEARRLYASHVAGTDTIRIGPDFFHSRGSIVEKFLTIVHEGYHMAYEYDKSDHAKGEENRPARSPENPNEHFEEYYAKTLLRKVRATPEFQKQFSRSYRAE
jgi:RHS repeat-associated protein